MFADQLDCISKVIDENFTQKDTSTNPKVLLDGTRSKLSHEGTNAKSSLINIAKPKNQQDTSNAKASYYGLNTKVQHGGIHNKMQKHTAKIKNKKDGLNLSPSFT